MTNELGNKIKELLAVSIGNFMANAAYVSSCKIKNIDPENITKEQLSSLADQMEILMRSKFGETSGKEMKNKILNLK